MESEGEKEMTPPRSSTEGAPTGPTEEKHRSAKGEKSSKVEKGQKMVCGATERNVAKEGWEGCWEKNSIDPTLAALSWRLGKGKKGEEGRKTRRFHLSWGILRVNRDRNRGPEKLTLQGGGRNRAGKKVQEGIGFVGGGGWGGVCLQVLGGGGVVLVGLFWCKVAGVAKPRPFQERTTRKGRRNFYVEKGGEERHGGSVNDSPGKKGNQAAAIQTKFTPPSQRRGLGGGGKMPLEKGYLIVV